MKAKKGYKDNKHRWGWGNWFKRYFTKRTCKDIKKNQKTEVDE